MCSVTTTYVIIRAIHLGDQMPSCLFASESYLIGNDLKPISLRMVDQLPNFIFLPLEFVSYIYYICDKPSGKGTPGMGIQYSRTNILEDMS